MNPVIHPVIHPVESDPETYDAVKRALREQCATAEELRRVVREQAEEIVRLRDESVHLKGQIAMLVHSLKAQAENVAKYHPNPSR